MSDPLLTLLVCFFMLFLVAGFVAIGLIVIKETYEIRLLKIKLQKKENQQDSSC